MYRLLQPFARIVFDKIAMILAIISHRRVHLTQQINDDKNIPPFVFGPLTLAWIRMGL